MNKNDIGFVVLNYRNPYETVQCVESILQIDGIDGVPVVVVENFSNDDSVEILRRYTFSKDDIVLLESNANLGYSGGNNIGINYLLSKGIRSVVIATSDTRILSTNFLTELLNTNIQNIGLIGPSVVDDCDIGQNPQRWGVTLGYLLQIKMPKIANALRFAFSRIFCTAYKKRVGGKDTMRSNNNSKTYPYMLHGCFLILTENYLAIHKGLDDSIFLYCEEDLLAYNCRVSGLRAMYNPKLKVYHSGQKSTLIDMSAKASNDFKRMHEARSNLILRKKMSTLKLLKFSIEDALR